MDAQRALLHLELRPQTKYSPSALRKPTGPRDAVTAWPYKHHPREEYYFYVAMFYGSSLSRFETACAR